MSTLDFPHVADERLRSLLVAVDNIEPGHPVSEATVLRIRDLTAKHIQDDVNAIRLTDMTGDWSGRRDALAKRMDLFDTASDLIDHGNLLAAGWALIKAWS